MNRKLQLRKFGDFRYDKGVVSVANTKRYVYFITVEKPIWYPNRKSRVVYIGKTASTANEAFSALGWMIVWAIPERMKRIMTGNTASIHLIGVREKMKPVELESAFIFAFRALCSEIPKGNTHGRRYTEQRVKTVKDKYGITLDALMEVLKSLE